jgi:hypothetical protein
MIFVVSKTLLTGMATCSGISINVATVNCKVSGIWENDPSRCRMKKEGNNCISKTASYP